jgi:hypothetical protein
LTALFEALNMLAGCDRNPIEIEKAWSVAGSSLSRDVLRTEDQLFAAMQMVREERDMSVTNRRVASFRRRPQMAARVQGNTNIS